MERYFIDKKKKVKEIKVPKEKKNVLYGDGYDYALTNNKTLTHLSIPYICWIQFELSDEQMQKATWEDFNKIIDVKEKHKQLLNEVQELYEKENEPPIKEMTQAERYEHERELIELGRYEELQELLYDLGYGAITEEEYDLEINELKNKWKAEDKKEIKPDITLAKEQISSDLITRYYQEREQWGADYDINIRFNYDNYGFESLAKGIQPLPYSQAREQDREDFIYSQISNDLVGAHKQYLREKNAKQVTIEHLLAGDIEAPKANVELRIGKINEFRDSRMSSKSDYDEFSGDKDFQDFIKQGGARSGVFDISDQNVKEFVKKYARFIYYGDVYERDSNNHLRPMFENLNDQSKMGWNDITLKKKSSKDAVLEPKNINENG